MWTDQLNAWSAVITAVSSVIVVIVALVAWRTARQTLHASREANEQAKHDSIEQTRPYVYAEVVPSLAGPPNWDVRVVNVGRSAARNLTLGYDAWPEMPDDVAASVREFFDTPRTLPPGCSIRAMWRLEAGSGKFDDGTAEAGVGKSGQISVSYTSDDPTNPTYRDRFDVMIERSGFWPIPEAGPEPVNIPKEIRSWYLAAQAATRHLGEKNR